MADLNADTVYLFAYHERTKYSVESLRAHLHFLDAPVTADGAARMMVA